MLVEAPAQQLGLVTRRSLWAELGGFAAAVPPLARRLRVAVAAAASGAPLVRIERALEAEPGDASGAERRHVRQWSWGPPESASASHGRAAAAGAWMEGYRDGVDAYRQAYEEECRAREAAEAAASRGRRGVRVWQPGGD